MRNGYYGRLRNGGPPLRLAYPIYGGNTFRPSGNPEADPPEYATDPEPWRVRWPGGEEQRRAYDAYMRSTASPSDLQQWAYWDRVQKLKRLSPRARKRAEWRERKAAERRNADRAKCSGES